MAQGRLAADAGIEDIGSEDDVSVWVGIVWALKDYRVWLFATLQMATTASISFSHFLPTLIQQIGFTNSTTTPAADRSTLPILFLLRLVSHSTPTGG